MFKNKRIIFILFFFISITSVYAGEKLFVINLNQEVGSTSWRYIQKGLIEADKSNATAVMIHMNTYGGSLEYADSIRTSILNYNRPIYTFIDNNAASAGALIAIACDSIFMRPGASIGAATVVNGSGEAMPDKYQSYMRSIIRATAETHGKIKKVDSNGDTVEVWFRNPIIAEAMVDPRTIVPEIGDDSSRVVTFTSKEAVKYGFCDGEANSIQAIAKDYLHYGNDYNIIKYEPTIWDTIFGFLTNPGFQAVLIMIIIGGIYFELQSPGMGFPSAAVVIAATLYFIPLYMEGAASGVEILIFFIGVVLLALEIFVIPGWGVAGISGIILIIASLFFAIIDNIMFDLDFVPKDNFYTALFTVIGGIILGVGVILYLSHKIGSKKGFMKNSALHLEQKIEDGYVGVPTNLSKCVGLNGVSATVLRPSGKISIDGTLYDAVSIEGYLEADKKVKVVKYENTQLYVIQDEK